VITHFKELDKRHADMNFTQSDGHLRLVTGTLDRLLEKSTDGYYVKHDKDFIHVFVLTHSYYISSEGLFEKLIELLSRCDVEKKWQRSIRLRILENIRIWVRDYGHELRRDKEFTKKYGHFYFSLCVLCVVCCMLYVVCCMLYVVCCMLYVVCCMLYVVCCMLCSLSLSLSVANSHMNRWFFFRLSLTQQHTNRRMKDFFDSFVTISAAEKGVLNFFDAVLDLMEENRAHLRRTKVKKRLKKKLPHTSGLQFLEVDPEELAIQITLIDQDLFKAVSSLEFLQQRFNNPDTSPSFTAIVKKFNETSTWVVNEILQPGSRASKRANLIVHFLKVADALRTIGNFNGCYAVISGLSNVNVSRLTHSWEVWFSL